MIWISTYLQDISRLHLIKKSFDSIINTTDISKIIVADDGSPLKDGIEYIKSLWIKVIERPINWGYAKCKNTLIKYILDNWYDIFFLADDDNIYSEWREEQSTSTDSRKLGNPQSTTKPFVRPTKYYNLDVILTVWYKVNSNRAIIFRKWAIKTLKEYIQRGFVMDDKRLKDGQTMEGIKDTVDRIEKILNK